MNLLAACRRLICGFFRLYAQGLSQVLEVEAFRR
jgi:hypothetical protein